MDNNFLLDAPTYLDFNLPNGNGECGNDEIYLDIPSDDLIDFDRTREVHSVHCEENIDIPSDDLIDFDQTLEVNSVHCEGNIDIPSDDLIDFDQTLEVNSVHCEGNIEFYESNPRKLGRSISAGNLLNLQEFAGSASHASYTKKNVSGRINVLAQPKRATRPTYTSIAEQIHKFNRTPIRFHTLKKNVDISNKQWKPRTESFAPTIDLHRHNNNVLSRDQIEKQEMEGLKKFKIKARPVNQKVLEGPIEPVAVAKKPSTIVKPFNLSENPLKKTGRTTSIKKTHNSTKLTPLVPFNFDERDRQGVRRREGLTSKVTESEKEATEFRTKPLPMFRVRRSSSLNNLKKPQSNVKGPHVLFKAKPPTVLYRKPFEPKKSERPPLETLEVNLNTDRRAKAWEDLEKKKQERMEQMAILKLQKESQQKLLEDKQVARLRKQTVHTAQPIRHYKEVKIEHSGKVTNPVTPKTLHRSKMYNNKK